MRYLRTPIAVVVVICLAMASVFIIGAGTARACSCVGVDAIDVIGTVDVVFTGTPIANDGSEQQPIWRFSVDGVIKGDAGSEESVIGDDIGCGPDFTQFVSRDAIVVFAYQAEDGLRARACSPVPTASEFAARLAAIEQPTGRGPPAAIMSGIYQTSDLAVIDDQGRTITRGSIGSGYGAIAHCAGTTTAAIVSWYPEALVTLIDLASMTVIEQRAREDSYLVQGGGSVACLDGGATVVTLSGYGPDNRTIELTSNSRDDGAQVGEIRASFSDVSRAVVHHSGTIILLPSKPDETIRALTAHDLQPIDGAQVQLPVGGAALAGDISPDGLRLAVLATVDGTNVAWDTGATHIVLFEVEGGVPVGTPASIIELADPGSTTESPTGAAKWIRWIDDSTFIVEAETTDGKKARILDTDGTETVANIELGWGHGLVPIPAGLLRATNGGIEVIRADGAVIAGDPAPLGDNSSIDRQLWIAPLVDAPDFTPTVLAATTIGITPVLSGSFVNRPVPEPTSEQRPVRAVLVVAALGGAVIGAAVILRRWYATTG